VEGALATSTRDDGAVWLTSRDATALLEAYGVPLASAVVVDSAEAAAAVQRELSLPVAVKAAAPIHKADVGGVELGMDTPAAAAAAVERIEQALRDHDLTEHLGSYLVQEMVGDGIEMVVGVTHDPSFGPLVLAGAGGTHVELLRDVSLRITPVTDVDVEEMLAACGWRRCSAATAAARPRTSRPSRTCCTASTRWSRTCRRSRSSTSTRCSCVRRGSG
jgi:acetate---CoA ligase (ADP-forming)